jgi:hypothetical protein
MDVASKIEAYGQSRNLLRRKGEEFEDHRAYYGCLSLL